MSEVVYPDGYSELKVAGTDSRMWVGPDAMVIYAYPLPTHWEVRFIFGEVTVVERLSSEELETRAVTHCRNLAGVTA